MPGTARSQVHPTFAVASKGRASSTGSRFPCASEPLSAALRVGPQVSNQKYELDAEQRRVKTSSAPLRRPASPSTVSEDVLCFCWGSWPPIDSHLPNTEQVLLLATSNLEACILGRGREGNSGNVSSVTKLTTEGFKTVQPVST